MDGSVHKAARPAARKSQIIEEEEGAEDEYEEVDTFTGTEEEPASPIGVTNSDLSGTAFSDQPTKPVLEPALDLDSSPMRPPRSSSLRAAPSLEPLIGSTHPDKAVLDSPRSTTSGKRSLDNTAEPTAK
jgi:hypothetical protein